MCVAIETTCQSVHSIPPPLLQHGANVNESDFWGYTPLHEAAAKNKLEICKLLLEHGAQVDAKTREGQTPFDLLKDKDGDLGDVLRGPRALLDAAKKGDLDRVSLGDGCTYVRMHSEHWGGVAGPAHLQPALVDSLEQNLQ